MRRVILATTALFLAGIIGPRFVLAQGENAVPMRSGTFQVSFGAAWWAALKGGQHRDNAIPARFDFGIRRYGARPT